MRPLPLGRIFAAPTLLAVLTAIGLVAALVGDGVWDAASWFMLGAPVAASLWYGSGFSRPTPTLPREREGVN